MYNLSDQEAQNHNGGVAFLIPVLIGITIAAGTNIIDHWDDFKAGLAKGWNAN
jgi:hypothetical protein